MSRPQKETKEHLSKRSGKGGKIVGQYQVGFRNSCSKKEAAVQDNAE